jgi:hypothetical protein
MMAFVFACIWEGFAALVIAVGTGVMAMHTYPTDPWQFVVLGAGGLIAATKAVDAYRRTPH